MLNEIDVEGELQRIKSIEFVHIYVTDDVVSFNGVFICTILIVVEEI